ncbi:hypothetical protein [Kitasatospora herbaricolor]|uniref:Uncharacterized protein n=1 Tax=Kitasatospora herbaricolor TaxID=68217 RepID=A0ABZ1WB53_9ACTN|nr:hypothetical protein [Kitasatospora herbaricolor]
MTTPVIRPLIVISQIYLTGWREDSSGTMRAASARRRQTKHLSNQGIEARWALGLASHKRKYFS